MITPLSDINPNFGKPPEVGKSVSVIVPTLNEAAHLESTLASLAGESCVHEVVVADGGSEDGTAEIAGAAGARFILASRGRGAQMAAGARIARGDIFWFLHPDTIPGHGTAAAVAAAMDDPHLAGGNCTICFDGNRSCARFLTRLYPHLRTTASGTSPPAPRFTSPPIQARSTAPM